MAFRINHRNTAIRLIELLIRGSSPEPYRAGYRRVEVVDVKIKMLHLPLLACFRRPYRRFVRIICLKIQQETIR